MAWSEPDDILSFGTEGSSLEEKKKFPYWIFGLLAVPLLFIKRKT